MMTNLKNSGKVSSYPVGLAIGAAGSMGLTVLLTGISAYLIGGEVLSEGSTGIVSVVILLLSSFVGALMAFGRIKSQRLLVCMLSGAIYYLLLLSCTALLFGGRYQGIAPTLLSVFGGCGVATLIGLKGERRGRTRMRKKLRFR